MTPIRKGDGTVIEPTGIQQVRKGDGTVLFDAGNVPDSVTNQYPVRNFSTSKWTDSVGSADMTVTGLTTSTFNNGADSVLGDGVDDFGEASTPVLGGIETFGIAFTISMRSTPGDDDVYMGSTPSGSSAFVVRSGVQGPNGNIGYFLSNKNSNTLREHTDSAFDDGNPHSVIMNKNANDTSAINIYVDDMSTPASTTVISNGSFNHTNYSQDGTNTGLFAEYDGSSSAGNTNIEVGVWEINTEPYSQSERQEFVDRRPEV